MKRMLQTILALMLLGASITAQAPTRLFDVRNGNGVIDGSTTYAAATVIPYKDAASKQKVVDLFALAYGYQDTINGSPNPQSKQAFYNAQLTRYIRDVTKSTQVTAASNTAAATAAASAEAELPPNQ